MARGWVGVGVGVDNKTHSYRQQVTGLATKAVNKKKRKKGKAKTKRRLMVLQLRCVEGRYKRDRAAYSSSEDLCSWEEA